MSYKTLPSEPIDNQILKLLPRKLDPSLRLELGLLRYNHVEGHVDRISAAPSLLFFGSVFLTLTSSCLQSTISQKEMVFSLIGFPLSSSWDFSSSPGMSGSPPVSLTENLFSRAQPLLNLEANPLAFFSLRLSTLSNKSSDIILRLSKCIFVLEASNKPV